MILVTPKQEVERKKEWFCGVKFFCSKFKVEWENGVWTKIRFLASGFLFTRGNFTLILFFFDFLDCFFLNGFLNPFMVRSRSSFLFSQWKFFELYVRFAIFVTTLWRHNHFKSAFCSFVHATSTRAWLNFWSHLTYLTLKNDFLSLKLTFVFF